MIQKPWARAAAKALRFSFTVAGTTAILATAWKSLQIGMFTLTMDVLVKLGITFAYAHGFTATDPRNWCWASASKSHHKSVEAPYLLDKDSSSEDGSISSDDQSCSMSEVEESPRITASVVGWREDAELYRNCLQCFAEDPVCGPVIAGVDGDTAVDEEMVDIFMNASQPLRLGNSANPLQMFPGASVIRLTETLATTMEQYMLSAKLTNVEDAQTCEFIMEHLSSMIRCLIEGQTSFQAIRDARGICVVQPHNSKKDILFTTLVFARVISEELGLEYVFSTDSDSAIAPGGLEQVVSLFDKDTNTGGVSGHLRFIHSSHTYISRMAASHYWFEQEISKAQGSIFGATEVQPGPCAGFRISALNLILVPWYCQRIFGQKVVTVEDRHLTTRILWAGFAVHYAPGAIVYTDTPNTFNAWVKQQVRWSRVTMIETLWFPWMLTQLSPVHVYNIAKARAVPILAFCAITLYALGFWQGISVSLTISADMFCALALQVVYLLNASVDKPTRSDLVWLVPTVLWFCLMTPGIVIWSLVTIFDDSWGNVPRGLGLSKENRQLSRSRFAEFLVEMRQTGFQLLWIGVLLAAALRACHLLPVA
ncbi:hyaluronan synthase [Diplocarpon rosae]|nr:hyaluronan synthase [Diplocarpon rosae]